MSATLTTLADLLKSRYAPRLHKQFETETPIAMRVKKKAGAEDFSGQKAIIAAHYRNSQAVGARGEGGTLPSTQSTKVKQMEVSVKYLYGKIKVTRPMMKASKDNPGSFARAMKLEMDGIRETLNMDAARQMMTGDGTGGITLANGAGAASASLTVDDTSNLYEGMVIDIYTSGGAQQVNSIEITAIDHTTKVCTLASTQTWSDNSIVFREDSRNNEMMGLKGIIDDGTNVATFQNLARSTYTWLKANVLHNSGTLRTLTLALVDQAFITAFNRHQSAYPSAIYSKPSYAVKYAQLLQDQRRFVAPQLTLDGGWKAVQYTGPGGTAPWIMDTRVEENVIYFPFEDDLGRWELTPVEFVDEDGNIFQRALDGTDAFEAVLATYQQMGAHRCNRSTILKDITAPF